MEKLKNVLLAIVFTFSIGIVASQDVKADITRFPNGLSSFGVPVLPGIGGNIFADVNVYWVDSTDANASTGADGSIDTPFSTIDAAVGQCVANQGDVILVKPGHIETVTAAGGLDLDIAGITIIGIGQGSLRPTVRLSTVATADVDVDAANITIVNLLFEARFADITAGIDVNAADFKMLNCETRDIDAGGEFITVIQTDANADRMLIDGYTHIGTSTPSGGNEASPLAVIALTGGDDIIIKNFNIYGDFDLSAIMATVTICTRLSIEGGKGSYIWTENATDSAISVNASTGRMGPNITAILQDNAANITEAFQGASMYFISPLPVVNTAGEQTATTTNITLSTDA